MTKSMMEAAGAGSLELEGSAEVATHREAGVTNGRGSGRSNPARQVLLAIKDLSFHREVLDFLERDPRADIAAAVTEPERALSLLKDSRFDAAILCPQLIRDIAHRPVGLLDLHRRRDSQSLLVVAEEMTVPVLREAIDARAAGAFAWPEERDALARAIAEAGLAPAAVPSGGGKVVAVLGARGGAGCTFLATHLAAALANLRISTALVDLDVGFSEITVAMGITTSQGFRTVADLSSVVHELSSAHVDDALHRHPRGFAALLAPTDTLKPSDEFVELYAASVPVLASDYGAVVLHVPRTLDGIARAGVELADEVVLVTALDLLSLHGAKRVVESLGLDGNAERCRVVVNRAGRAQLTPADVHRVLELRPYASVRFDSAVQRVQDRGELLPQRSRRAWKDVIGLARRLASSWVPSAQGA